MPTQDAIVIHDSDSEPEMQPVKRQKTRPSESVVIDLSEDSMVVDDNYAEFMRTGTKNTDLKGRKRFNADLNDAKEVAKNGVSMHGLRLWRLRAGDEEGSLEVVITRPSGEHILALNLLVSDTSEYPKDHTFFSYSQDADVQASIREIIEDIANEPSRTIVSTVDGLCKRLGSVLGIVSFSTYPTPKSEAQEIEMEDEEEEEEEEGYESYDDFIVPTDTSKKKNAQMARLRDDFVDVVASCYRPGIINFGADDFCLSVSLPVIELANSVPARALVAWDRRLLSKTQHLTLLICGLRGVYPLLGPEGTLTPDATSVGVNLAFKVGLSARYKPGKENVREASRNFGLILQDAEDELRIQAEKAALQKEAFEGWDDDEAGQNQPPEPVVVPEEEEPEDEGRFDKFSLSNSLESLMDQSFLKIVQFRCKFGLGWSGAELLLWEVEKSQKRPDEVYNKHAKSLMEADRAENRLRESYSLPDDILAHKSARDPINLPLVAFCYLIRRLTLCTQYCIVCHNKLTTDYEALKPYLCDSKLCQYQYYSLNRGPSLEYEIIHNPQTVDMLLSITFIAAAEGVLDEPFPVGMGLRVPKPDSSKILQPPQGMNMGRSMGPLPIPVPTASSSARRDIFVGNDGLCDFDDLSAHEMRASIVEMINKLPPINDMRKHLLRKVKSGKAKPKLQDADPNAPAAAWSILRWCVGSCTAYLEEITSEEERIGNIDASWRQYRFSVGAPDMEAKYKSAVTQAQLESPQAQKFPSLFAFHGSPVRNWHSIIRHGLWYKTVANGRAYGDGVYLAKDGTVSMGHYAQGTRVTGWKNSKVTPTQCAALAEVVNLPQKFVSHNPFFVIKDTHWIVCRYLLIKGGSVETENQGSSSTAAPTGKGKSKQQVPVVAVDPKHPVTMGNKPIEIPEPSYQLNKLLEARRFEMFVDDPDHEDQKIFEYVEQESSGQVHTIEDSDDEMDFDFSEPVRSQPAPVASTSNGPSPQKKSRPANDWKHDPKWVEEQIRHLMPPPLESTPSATMAVQRELKTMLKEQSSCSSFAELGWYMPEELIGDNLFQWIVEMHSFDPDIPIAKDLKARKINSLIFEIRFPPNFPLSPPFFRIITPRFLPFIHGGGGHVTGGGSICMDLLTADGWLPSYSISAVLMQIKLAISNLDPRPARLAPNWNQQYRVDEALAGYKRAAATHNWALPPGLDKLVR